MVDQPTDTSLQNNSWNASQIDVVYITVKECQRVEISSGLMMNNCGGDEGISTHQPSHIVEPMIAHILAVILYVALMSHVENSSCGVILVPAVE